MRKYCGSLNMGLRAATGSVLAHVVDDPLPRADVDELALFRRPTGQGDGHEIPPFGVLGE